MSKQEPLNLDQLTESYEIIGEMARQDIGRVFHGKRRSDGKDVVIVVSTAPADDRGNALSHMAADTKLLAGQRHPSLLPVLDGAWVGTDAFATVMERTRAPSLHELLSRRDEEFEFPRIATILREANAVLEWARERKVVHRMITPETVFVEPGSDRVCVSFAVSPLPTSGVPGAEADARAIAALARAMFTRSPMAPERAEQPLAELRPGLPNSLVEETGKLLDARPADGEAAAADVTGYIARIAMAEALKDGEVQLEATRKAIEEQKRAHDELIARERKAHDEELATARKEHQRLVEEQARQFARERENFAQQLTKERERTAQQFAKERENFERELAKERKALLAERAALAKERAAHAKACEALAREREAHAKDRAALLEERARVEKAKEEERARVAAEAAALREQARIHAQMAEAQAAQRKQVLEDAKRANAETKKAGQQFKKTVVKAPSAAPTPLFAQLEPTTTTAPRVEPESKEKRPSSLAALFAKRPHWDSRWNVPAAAIALLLLITITALAVGDGAKRRAEPVAQVATRSGVTARIVDSAAGTVTQYESIVPLPQVTTDTAALAAAATDWTPPPRRRRPVEPVRARDPGVDESSGFTVQQETPRRLTSEPSMSAPIDSFAPRPAVRVDTVYRRDTVLRSPIPFPPRRDSAPRPDTLLRRDTIP